MNKLYYFKTNTFAEEACVCAESKEQAIEFLLAKKIDSTDPEYKYRKYFNLCLDDMANCRNGYTIEEHEAGSVVFTEVS
jgi:hypothetical protein